MSEQNAKKGTLFAAFLRWRDKNRWLKFSRSLDQNIYPLVLVGMPGCGKSRIGCELAARLGVQFADTDKLIEERQGMSVAQIFEQQGEAKFRELEAEVIAQAVQHAQQGQGVRILALGGGALTSENTRILIQTQNVLYPVASRSQLLARLKDDDKRPLLRGDKEHKEEVLDRLYKQRGGTYREVSSFCVPANWPLQQKLNVVCEALALASLRGQDLKKVRPEDFPTCAEQLKRVREADYFWSDDDVH